MTEISSDIIATSIAIVSGLVVALLLWLRTFRKDSLNIDYDEFGGESN